MPTGATVGNQLDAEAQARPEEIADRTVRHPVDDPRVPLSNEPTKPPDSTPVHMAPQRNRFHGNSLCFDPAYVGRMRRNHSAEIHATRAQPRHLGYLSRVRSLRDHQNRKSLALAQWYSTLWVWFRPADSGSEMITGAIITVMRQVTFQYSGWPAE